MSLPSNLYQQIRRAFIASGQFETDNQVKNLFVDARLSPWRNRLPLSGNLDERVDSVIRLLDQKFNSRGEPGLISLIMVLLDRVHPEDICHSQLTALQEVLSQEFSQSAINIEEELRDLLSETDPRLKRLEILLQQLRANNEVLREWKQLHRYLDNLTNLTYGQFAAQIERFKGTPLDPLVLRDAWKPVLLMVNRMLEWAKTIEYIGEPYKVEQDIKRGVVWAIKLGELTEAIHQHLLLVPAEMDAAPNRPKSMWRFFTSAKVRASDTDYWRGSWWPQLVDLSGQLEHDLRLYMSMADENLRQTASDLYELSREILWSEAK